MKKFHYLYKITHIKSQRIYYGIHSTDDMNDRYFGNGVYESRVTKNGWTKTNHGKENYTHMQNALIKYGRNAFKREIVKTFKTRKAAFKEEQKIVTKAFIDREDNFNHRTGGKGNVEFSEEVRQKISENNPMKRKDVRKKISEAQKKSWTAERRKKASEDNWMKKEENKHLISGENHSWFGRQHTEESKKKLVMQILVKFGLRNRLNLKEKKLKSIGLTQTEFQKEKL